MTEISWFHSLATLADRLRLAAEDGQGVLESGLAALVAGFPPWCSAGMMEADPATGIVSLVGRFGAGGPLYEGLPKRWPLSESPCREVLGSGAPFLAEDIRAGRAWPLYRIDAEVQGYHAVLLMPVAGWPERVLALHARAPRRPGTAELAALGAAVSVLGAALRADARLAAARHDDAGRLRGACPPELAARVGDLLADRRAMGRKLAETARVFAEQGGRVRASAGELGIHPSTLRYRLELLKERNGIDLEDPGVRRAVYTVLLIGTGEARAG